MAFHEAISALWKLAFGELPPGPLREHCVACVRLDSMSTEILMSLATVCVAQHTNDEASPCTLLHCLLDQSSLWPVLVEHYRARSSEASAMALSIIVDHYRRTQQGIMAMETFELDDYERTLYMALVEEDANRMIGEEANRLTRQFAAAENSPSAATSRT